MFTHQSCSVFDVARVTKKKCLTELKKDFFELCNILLLGPFHVGYQKVVNSSSPIFLKFTQIIITPHNGNICKI